MNLGETLKLMYVNEASGERNIKLKEYWNTGNGRIVYDGKLKDLLSYMETHDNLNQCDGFPVQVQSIHKWDVVEILVDRTIEKETGLPDFNRGKIIVIQWQRRLNEWLEEIKMGNMPIYDYDDAINFIAERSDIGKDVIEKVLSLEEDYMRSIGIIENEDVVIYADKVKEYLLSDDISTNDIESFLGYPISWDVLEGLESYIDEVMSQMPNDIIKEYYDRFFGWISHFIWKIGKRVKFYIDKRIYCVYTNIKGISIVYTRREKPYGTKDDTREETLHNTDKYKEVGKQSGY